MGLTFFSARNNPFGHFSNPATLGQLSSAAFGTHYTRLFGLKDLSQSTGATCLPIRTGGMGLGFRSFGNALYQEAIFHGGWGLPVYKSLSLGILCNIGQLRIRKYGSSTVFWINTGLLYSFSKKILMAASIANLNQARIGKIKDPLPQTTCIGIECRPRSGIKWDLELFKDVRFPLEIRSGLEVIPFSFLALRCGFTDQPQRITTGIGIQIRKLSVDYAVVCHPDLGLTHHASIILILNPETPSPLWVF
ncbi:hypothetical protein JW835_02135 [bacterium]|nr:hypothetical protein [bacterium]